MPTTHVPLKGCELIWCKGLELYEQRGQGSCCATPNNSRQGGREGRRGEERRGRGVFLVAASPTLTPLWPSPNSSQQRGRGSREGGMLSSAGCQQLLPHESSSSPPFPGTGGGAGWNGQGGHTGLEAEWQHRRVLGGTLDCRWPIKLMTGNLLVYLYTGT